ncbi:MAG: STAS domain-containing protein [Clostridia bacterium]|nr:STAS domain-containing protein [Clostridia bacterium]
MIKNSKNLAVAQEGNAVVVALAGEIDHHNASGLRADIDKLIYEERPPKMVLDLANIEFMDSSGLGLIMGRYSLVKEFGGELTVRNPNARVLKICKLAGLERMIRIEKKG